MGRAIASLAPARGHEIALVIDEAENPEGRALTAERLRGIDAAIEFSTPAAAPLNLVRLIEAGIPTVCGTTGWQHELPRITMLARQRHGALVHAANFSVGVQIFLRAARDLARGFAGRREFDGFIVEEHHAKKVDAPSGTAQARPPRCRTIRSPRPAASPKRSHAEPPATGRAASTARSPAGSVRSAA